MAEIVSRKKDKKLREIQPNENRDNHREEKENF